jgi:UDP-glucose-4-epimerase GalE
MGGSVIVTGGAGYIGSHACKALARAGFVPVTYDNLSIGNRWAVRWGPFELGDIHDAARLHDVFRAHRPVGVLHFAALALVGESVTAPSLYYRTNVTGLCSVLDVCRARDVNAFVFSSTCAVYGAPARLPIDEATPTAPINPYGASKLMAERVLADYDAAYGLRHVALRYFNAAGADPEGEIGERRDVESHLVPLAIDAVAGRRPPIRIMGEDYATPDGTAVRDYIHVSDLAEAHVRALRHLLDGGASRVLNLGVGRGYSVREVLDAAARAAGRPVPSVSAPRRPGDPPALVADPTAAQALFGEDLAQRSSLDHIVETAWRWQNSDFYDRVFFAR